MGLNSNDRPHTEISVWVRIIAPFIPATAMLIVFGLFLLKPQKTAWDILWVCAVQIIVTWLLLAMISRWTWRPAVWLALRDAGHHLCLHCGYSHNNLPDDVRRCPECGNLRLLPSEEHAS